jgi:hypothetical protein
MTVTGNRITDPTTTANATEDARLAPVSPTGAALLPQAAVRVAAVVVALAGAGVVVFGTISAPWAATGAAICGAIVALGAALGIASPGVRSAPPK